MLDSTIINVSFRIFFVRKIKGWSSPFSLNNTNWNAFKQVINNYTIYYWSQVITSSTFKSWHKKKNSISIPYRTSTKLSSLNFSKKQQQQQIQVFQIEIWVTAKTQTTTWLWPKLKCAITLFTKDLWFMWLHSSYPWNN